MTRLGPFVRLIVSAVITDCLDVLRLDPTESSQSRRKSSQYHATVPVLTKQHSVHRPALKGCEGPGFGFVVFHNVILSSKEIFATMRLSGLFLAGSLSVPTSTWAFTLIRRNRVPTLALGVVTGPKPVLFGESVIVHASVAHVSMCFPWSNIALVQQSMKRANGIVSPTITAKSYPRRTI
jgi:hypothetical protein